MAVNGLSVLILGITIASSAVTSLNTEGDVRLQGVDNTAFQGRVEIYHDGAWLSVCDGSWDFRKGDVICRQLGFSGGAMSTDMSALYGEGTSVSWLTGVTCSGTENGLTECMVLTYGTGTCSHQNDVGVRCTYPMYEGCYSSSGLGPLTAISVNTETMTISGCLVFCRDQNNLFAGVQDKTCRCGDDISSGTKQGNLNCNGICPGDTTEICGGGATASIYSTKSSFSLIDNSGGYITSPSFPAIYSPTDVFNSTVPIPSESNFAVVSFLYFKLAVGDTVTLLTPGGTQPSRIIPGTTDGVLPAFWNSEPAISFSIQFAIVSTLGDRGFVMQYKFGLQCSPADLPVSIPQGSFTATQTSYFYKDEVAVNCMFGYEPDKEGFLCQMDGTWSPAPVCSLITTTEPPTTESVDSDSTTSSQETTPSGDGMTVPGGPTVSTVQASTSVPLVPCPIQVVSNGVVDTQGRTQLFEGDDISVTCNDTFAAADNRTTATCSASGSYDIELVCAPGNNTPVWLIAIIVAAAVLAIVVVVLIILVALVSSEPKQPERRGRRPPVISAHQDYGAGLGNGDEGEDRLVAIPQSVQQNPSPRSSIISDSVLGAINQGAQTEDDLRVAEHADPVAGDTDVYHPTRDYPGAGARRAPVEPLRPPLLSQPIQPMSTSRQVSMEYRPNGDFSMLANEELLAVGALDSVVQDFGGDQAYYLGPTSPGMYMDRGSRYSRQVQFSQRSRLNNFYGLY